MTLFKIKFKENFYTLTCMNPNTNKRYFINNGFQL